MNNVLLISVDCLRADAVGCYGNELPTTPNIDSIAQNGAKFDACYANGGRTQTSFPALMGSVYFDMYEGPVIPPSQPLLPDVFSRNGYTTMGVNAANPNLTHEFGYDSGLDYYLDYIFQTVINNDTRGGETDEVQHGNDNITNRASQYLENHPKLFSLAQDGYKLFHQLLEPYRKARNYFRYLRGGSPNSLSSHICPPSYQIWGDIENELNKLVTSEGRFFIWIHFMDPHAWYDPDTKFVKELYNETVDRSRRFKANRALMSASPFSGSPDINKVRSYLPELLKLYHSAVKQVDSTIGEIYEFIESKGEAEETVTCIVSDHGEAFLEHGNVQHDGGVFSELTHVPLVINGPGVPSVEIEEPCGLVDLPPTLCDLAGSDKPEEFNGSSLYPRICGEQINRYPVISSDSNTPPTVAARDADYTYVAHPDKERVYHIAEDRFEQEPIEIDNGSKSRLESSVSDYLDEYYSKSESSNKFEPSDETQNRLEDLGYL
jgi:arylsulfatase A-like enzyme